MWVRRETGVRINATATQAIRLPVAAPKPSYVMAIQRKAWANMPTATGHGSIWSGVEKNTLYAATATPAAMTSCHSGTALPVGSTGKDTPSKRQPEQQSRRDRDDDQARIDQAGDAERYAAVDEVERAIEEMRTRHQHHARADHDKAQRRTEFIADRQRADDAGKERRAERLQEEIRAQLAQCATQQCAGAGTHKYQSRSRHMVDAEDHRQRYGAGRRGKREQPCRRRCRARDACDALHGGIRREAARFDGLDRPHRRRHAIHVHARRIGRHLDRSACPAGLDQKLQPAPARHDGGAQSQRAGKALGRAHRLFRSLSVDVENPGKAQDQSDRSSAVMELPQPSRRIFQSPELRKSRARWRSNLKLSRFGSSL